MKSLRETFMEHAPRLAERTPADGGEDAGGRGPEWDSYSEVLREMAEEADPGDGDFATFPHSAAEEPEGDARPGLAGLVSRMPEMEDLDRENERNREFYLLELPASATGGAPDTVEIRVDIGQTVFAVFGTDGVCEQRFAVDSGWAVCCRYPISSDGRIIRLKRTGEIEAAVCGRLAAYGDPVDTGDLTAFLDGHIARIVSFGLDRMIVSALRYRDVVVRGPEWLRPAMEGTRALLPHLRIGEGF